MSDGNSSIFDVEEISGQVKNYSHIIVLEYNQQHKLVSKEDCCSHHHHVTAVIRPYENPRALQGRTVFNRYLGIGRSNQKNSKNKVHLFSNLASGRTLPTQSTGPQPIQLVPKHRFLHISLYRSLKSKNFKKQGGFIF